MEATGNNLQSPQSGPDGADLGTSGQPNQSAPGQLAAVLGGGAPPPAVPSPSQPAVRIEQISRPPESALTRWWGVFNMMDDRSLVALARESRLPLAIGASREEILLAFSSAPDPLAFLSLLPQLQQTTTAPVPGPRPSSDMPPRASPQHSVSLVNRLCSTLDLSDMYDAAAGYGVVVQPNLSAREVAQALVDANVAAEILEEAVAQLSAAVSPGRRTPGQPLAGGEPPGVSLLSAVRPGPTQPGTMGGRFGSPSFHAPSPSTAPSPAETARRFEAIEAALASSTSRGHVRLQGDLKARLLAPEILNPPAYRLDTLTQAVRSGADAALADIPMYVPSWNPSVESRLSMDKPNEYCAKELQWAASDAITFLIAQHEAWSTWGAIRSSLPPETLTLLEPVVQRWTIVWELANGHYRSTVERMKALATGLISSEFEPRGDLPTPSGSRAPPILSSDELNKANKLAREKEEARKRKADAFRGPGNPPNQPPPKRVWGKFRGGGQSFRR